MRNVFIIGSKGIPARYGGFETFVDKLTERKKSSNIKYHIACLDETEKEFEYNNARCFTVKVKNIGNAKAVLYDIKSLKKCISYIEKNNLKNCIVYALTTKIGPFLILYKNKLKHMGIKLYVNPDGHEWKRSKWNTFIRKYWKFSENYMVKNADLLICDSKEIEKYIKQEYKRYCPKTIYISYGADLNKSPVRNESEKLINWYKKFDIKVNSYYLVVGRFVPENNYETIIREFMKSGTEKDLVIVTNIEENNYYNNLVKKTKFKLDKRIKFVGTVYDQALLMKIRENAFAYIHGHEVGGTNPSLLEALASTKVNLLLDVSFNREVGQDGALYFDKTEGSLTNLIKNVEKYSELDQLELQKRAKNRINGDYLWEKIVNEYEKIFLKI